MRPAPARRLFPPLAHAVVAAVAGLALRLFLVLRFPTDAGDTGVYEELARNWLDAHVYGLVYANGLVPSDIRAPGYPAFLALLYLFLGRGQGVILLAQAIVDLGTCFLIAWLVSRLVPESQRGRASLAALWLAATCPLMANYAAVPLTEVLATFLTAAALIPLANGCASFYHSPFRTSRERSAWNTWFAGGLLVGIGTLVRPETPLLLAALALVLVIRWRRPADWGKLLRAGALTALGLALPLLPWAARNCVRFHEVQFLAPRYAATPDEYTPRGLYAWTATWLVRFRDVYIVPWNIGSARIQIDDIPNAAFDSPGERARVATLLDQYNPALKMTPEIDRGFAELARERTSLHPLRTYILVPLGRAATIWFTPRVELLPFSGHLWPIRERWRHDKVDFSATILLGILNFFYVGLALAGLRRALNRSGALQPGFRTALALLVVFVLVRTAFLTTIETPEPRYVLECFPAVLAMGAMAWLPRAAVGVTPVHRAARDGL